jgi:hypothetical protein
VSRCTISSDTITMVLWLCCTRVLHASDHSRRLVKA